MFVIFRDKNIMQVICQVVFIIGGVVELGFGVDDINVELVFVSFFVLWCRKSYGLFVGIYKVQCFGIIVRQEILIGFIQAELIDFFIWRVIVGNVG